MLVVVGEERRRDYRKGNWTLNETMVLIEAKKTDNERRMKRLKKSEERMGGSSSSSRSSEMRWKWVEDYCWRYGCYRSQNQCNDRWDNLMRDFKKVRTYEMSFKVEESDRLSYWKLERHERKERNLPSSLLPEIYEALIEVVERRDSDDDENSNSPERKRRRGGISSSKSNSHKVSSAISKCASILAETFQASEEKEMRRHKDLMRIKERKAKIEQSKAEISVQSMDSLAAAINQLASSILGSVADKGSVAPK
ncbi:trihelix transcription factor ASR3 [Cocos nucifera]|uniref:Trihelix transcription factor ASR3 n=1 Tax=Cocos nucifera TaxID=13894 RepID=A0A8K0IDT7_COCNU|nr:trihelix transcription factor ASR3 [Cocos nucifera]